MASCSRWYVSENTAGKNTRSGPGDTSTRPTVPQRGASRGRSSSSAAATQQHNTADDPAASLQSSYVVCFLFCFCSVTLLSCRIDAHFPSHHIRNGCAFRLRKVAKLAGHRAELRAAAAEPSRAEPCRRRSASYLVEPHMGGQAEPKHNGCSC